MRLVQIRTLRKGRKHLWQITCSYIAVEIWPARRPSQAASLKEWEAWFGKLGTATVDGGNPFSGQAKTVASDGQDRRWAGHRR